MEKLSNSANDVLPEFQKFLLEKKLVPDKVAIKNLKLIIRGSCKSMFSCLKSVIPAKAGIQKSLILKELDSRLRTSGMTFLDFCKSLINFAFLFLEHEG